VNSLRSVEREALSVKREAGSGERRAGSVSRIAYIVFRWGKPRRHEGEKQIGGPQNEDFGGGEWTRGEIGLSAKNGVKCF
jgi:hypothetical protein